jgi:hypothetical protein
MTIASAVESEVDLEMVETHHICPEKALAELSSREKFRTMQQRIV